MKAPNPPRKPRQNRRAGHPKRAQLLRRDRLEKLLALLRDRGPITPSKLRSLHRIERWEVKQAELLGWVEVGKGPRPRSGPRPTLVWPEEDTSQARLPVEEWEVPFVIPEIHRVFAALTLEVVCNSGRGGVPIYKSVTAAYREAYASCHYHRPSNAYQLLKRGSVQAVRAWLLAQSSGDVDTDEEMPETVEGIEFRLRGAGWTDGRFEQARRVGRRRPWGRKWAVAGTTEPTGKDEDIATDEASDAELPDPNLIPVISTSLISAALPFPGPASLQQPSRLEEKQPWYSAA